MADLQEKLKLLPNEPGVYLMKDESGAIIYVGKAKNLKNRVTNYFSTAKDSRYSTHFISRDTEDFDILVTNSEKEAFLLEEGLIKQHRPRYNVIYRDDKTFLSLRLDMSEEFPRFIVARRPKKDGAQYFGPYTSAHDARATLRFIRDLFGLRSCSEHNFRNRLRPCLDYQIKKCLGPCRGLVSKEDYRRAVEEAVLFLKGRRQELVKDYTERMWRASEAEDFETAARLRNRMAAVSLTLEKQQVAATDRFANFETAALVRWEDEGLILLMSVRDGRIVGHIPYFFHRVSGTDEEILSSFLLQYYSRDQEIPDLVLASLPLADGSVLADILTEKKGRKVEVIAPRRGEKKGFVDLALKNAEAELAKRRASRQGRQDLLEQIKRKLRLKQTPLRIEAYDISNISGKNAVGSQVVFIEGEPAKKFYRSYRIRTLNEPDDYAMLYEVLSRRFAPERIEEERPQLILIDGGKGQLGVAREVLKELKVEGVELASLAKDRHPDGEEKAGLEKVYRPGRKDPAPLNKDSRVLLLLQSIRDEAHRFALSRHHQAKKKSDFTSRLESIPGIGAARRRQLLKDFGSIAALREAPLEALLAVPGMSRPAALAIKDFLAKEKL